MPLFRSAPHTTVGSTTRLEAYSDAVMAIILTILVLELRVPDLHDNSVRGVLLSLAAIAPKLASFTFSFLAISVFWVNHHHFFHEVDRADARLLWTNNILLFWLALIPFTTAYLGEHPMIPGVIMLYCFVLCMAALSYMLMTMHALRYLAHDHIPMEQRKQRYWRSWIGVGGYALATVIAPFVPLLSVALMFAIPVYYIVPRLMHDHEAMT